jgi:hypothetical protein
MVARRFDLAAGSPSSDRSNRTTSVDHGRQIYSRLHDASLQPRATWVGRFSFFERL